jgi:prevent-host-death family protein
LVQNNISYFVSYFDIINNEKTMKFNLHQDIRPLSEVRTNTASLIKQIQESKRPVVITQHGRSVAVLVEVEEFQRLCEERELFRAIAQSEQEIAKGNVTPHKEVMKRQKERLKSK